MVTISGAGYNTTTSMLRTPIPVLTGSASFATTYQLFRISNGRWNRTSRHCQGTIAASLFPQNPLMMRGNIYSQCGYDYATDTKGKTVQVKLDSV